MMSMNSEAMTAGPASFAEDKPWLRHLPLGLAAVGGVTALIGAFGNTEQFAYSYLLAFMFFLSICLGSLFLVLVHHLFDSYWSVPIRRFVEHLACLLPVMGILFIPIAVLAKTIYPWMRVADPHADHALHVKVALLNQPAFYIVALILFAVWTWLSLSLRSASLEQDRSGAASCTSRMRKLSAGGIFIFAFSLTAAAIYWVKSLQYQWFSTMYGVYYFAGSVWLTLATVYVIALALKNTGPLAAVVRERQFHDIGVLMLAFTVFYAYIHFSQYFLIWNAAIPEETFWYVQRNQGAWHGVGLTLIFGHFVIPFLMLLRIDGKLNAFWMVALAVWAWIMHFVDLSFNIMPVIDGPILPVMALACMAFIGGILGFVFLKFFYAHPPYPQRDPRMAEVMGVHVPNRSAAWLTTADEDSEESEDEPDQTEDDSDSTSEGDDVSGSGSSEKRNTGSADVAANPSAGTGSKAKKKKKTAAGKSTSKSASAKASGAAKKTSAKKASGSKDPAKKKKKKS